MCFVLRAALAAELVNVRFGGDAATTRIVIDADGPISAPATPLVSQGRLTLSLGGLTTRQPSAGQGKGLISGWRFEPRDARVVLEVKEPVTVTHRFLLPPADGRDTFRYVMDIARAGGPSDDPLPLTRAEISGREASAPLPPALKTHLASMAAAAPDRPRAPRARGGSE